MTNVIALCKSKPNGVGAAFNEPWLREYARLGSSVFGWERTSVEHQPPPHLAQGCEVLK